MRRFTYWILTLMLIITATRVAAYKIPSETWMGTYMGEKKVGYLSFKIENSDFNGTNGYKITSLVDVRLTVLGTDLTQLVNTVVYTDKQFHPLKEDFSMSSGGKTTRISATFGKDAVECVVSAGSGSSRKSIPIPKGANLVGDATFAFLNKEPNVGETYSVHYFNPLTLTVDEMKVKVAKQETITIEGRKINTLVMQNVTPMGEMTIWQDKNGDVVKVKAVMGFTMIREPRKKATSGVVSGSNEDFAVLTSVKPDRPIDTPRKVKKLDLVLSGLEDPKLIISDHIQTVAQQDSTPGAYRVSVSSLTFNPADSVERPITDPKLEPYLAITPYLDYDIKAVEEMAAEVVGDETNAYTACSKIRKWIHDNLSTRADIGITRSASDVLKSRVGVCRDFAILFAALARSQGIPAKIATGLLYTDGAFYYHAWVECFVGEWVPFDPTLDSDFVDATHVKLAEGDPTTMFGMAKVIGNLKAEVVDYEL